MSSINWDHRRCFSRYGKLNSLQTMVVLWAHGNRSPIEGDSSAIDEAIYNFQENYITGRIWTWCKICGEADVGACCIDNWIDMIDPAIFC